MKCIKCGFEFDEGSFCPECGTKYDENEAKRIEEEKALTEKKKLEEEKALTEKKKLEEEKKRLEAEVEKKRIAKEEMLRKKQEDELRKQEEERVIKADQEKREAEIIRAKADIMMAKAEQERIAKERVEQEAELLRQQNESIRLQRELEEKKLLDEQTHQEELKRTFNGVLYSSVEEMTNAKNIYIAEQQKMKESKKKDGFAIASMVLGIAAYPLIMTVVLWFPAVAVSIVFGIIALVKKSRKKGFAIAGLVVDGVLLIGLLASMIYGISAMQ